MKIKNKIFLSVFLISLLVLSMITVFFVINGYKEIVHTAEDYFLDDANEHSEEITSFFENKFLLAETIANTPIVTHSLLTSNAEYSTLSEGQIKNKINDLNNKWLEAKDVNDPFVRSYLDNDVSKFLISNEKLNPDEYGEIYLTNKYGVLIGSTNKLTTLAHGQKYFWRDAYAFGNVVDDRGFDESVGDMVLGISTPVIFEGQVIGVLKSNFLMEAILKKFPYSFQHQHVKGNKQHFSVLLRSNGEIVGAKEVSFIDKKVLNSIALGIEKGVAGTQIISSSGKKILAAYSPVEIPFSFDVKSSEKATGPVDHTGGNIGYGWYMLSLSDLNIVLEPLYDTLKKILFIGIFLIIIMSMSVYLISNKIMSPINKLVDAAQRVGNGDYSVSIDVDSDDELGELSQTFDQMKDSLKHTTTSIINLQTEMLEREKTEKKLRENESFIRSIMDSIPIGIAVNSVDPDVNFSYMNDNFTKFYRTTKEALYLNGSFWDAVYEDPIFREEIKQRVLDDCASGDKACMFWENIPLTRKGKETTFISARNVPMGNSNQSISMVWDVTEQLKVQQELLNKEAQISGITNSVPGVLYQFYARPNNEYGLYYISEQAEDVFGIDVKNIDPSELFPTFIQNLVPEHKERFVNSISNAVQNITSWRFEGGYIRPDGKIIDFEGISQPVVNKNEIVFNGVLFDITERKKIEDEIKILSRMPAENPDPIMRVTKDGQIIYANRSSDKLLDFCGCKLSDHLGDAWKNAISESFEKNENRTIELSVCGFVWEFVIAPIADMGYVNVYGRDITKLKDAIKYASDAKKNWDEIFDTITDAITIHDADFNVLFSNNAAQKLLGRSADEINSNKCYFSYHNKDFPPDNCASCKMIKTGEVSVCEIFEPSIAKFVEIKAIPRFDENKNLIGVIHIARDITDRKTAESKNKELQEQLFQAQKLEAIGTMASGIAHNFNNILGAIQGSVEMVLDDIGPDSRTREDLQRIVKGVESAKQLTDQMMAYSRPKYFGENKENIVTIVKDAINMFKASIKGSIEIKEVLDCDCGSVTVDPNEMQHVLLNLLRNSYQAIDTAHGLIEVELSKFIVDFDLSRKYHNIKEGNYVRVSIIDNGHGMDDETVSRMFEPFFTTKDVGQGTGLGLSMVHGIISGYRGEILVESILNEGTKVHILLPSA